MLTDFNIHINNQLSFLKQGSLLIAVSGGLDSVVLAHLCKGLNLNFSLAHCNYNLRGAESNADQKFVEELGVQLNCKVHITSFDTNDHKKTKDSSIQLVARELRYEWFYKLLQAHNYDYILTAHHADDNLETYIINLSRGTGLKGLMGIPEQNQNIVRPLLPFPRTEILHYAKSEGLEWREDSSNSDTKYLRNKIRHEIVFRLKELNPNFLGNFMLSQENLIGTSNLLQNYKQDLKAELFIKNDKVYSIDIKKLKSKQPLKDYLYLLFQDYGFTQWADIQNLLDATSGKKIYSNTHQLVKDRDTLLLSEFTENNKEVFWIEKQQNHINKPFMMKMIMVEEIANWGKQLLYVDMEKLKFPLMLRKWNNGDYFYPLGMKGKKKLSKYFKDEKLDILSKNNVWLLLSDNKIVWVIGNRADERFKVTGNTKTILKLELH